MPLRGYRPSWPADQIGQDYTPNCRNVRFRFGEARNAPGRDLLTGKVDPGGLTVPKEITQFYEIDGLTVWPLLLTTNKLYRFGSSVPGTPEQWHNIPGNFTPAGTGFLWNTVSGEGRFFFANGDKIGQWDGVVGHNFDVITPTDSGTVPRARYLAYFNNRLITAATIEGGITRATRIRWAQNGDFTKWDDTTGLGAGFLDIADDTEEPIRGVAGLSGELAIYTRRSIKGLVPTGTITPTFAVQTRQRGIGCDAPYTIAGTGFMNFFLGYDRNVWMWDGLAVKPVGLPIWDELRALTSSDNMATYFGKVFSTREEYWLVIGTDVFVYDYIRDSWSRDSFPSLTAMGEIERTFAAKRWVDLVGSWNDQTLRWLQFAGFTVTTLFGARSDGSTMMIDDSVADDYFAIGSIVDRFLETEDMYLGYQQGGIDSDAMRQGVVLRQLLVYSFVNAEPFEIGISTDRGRTWLTQEITPNDCGLSLIDWIVTGETVRFRFRENNAMGKFRWSSYEYEWLDAGDYIGSGTCPTGVGSPPQVQVSSFTLTITTSGSGMGAVTSNSGGISCPGTCTAMYPTGTTVVLTATPSLGQDFGIWSGDVPLGHELNNPLTIIMNNNKTIDALFIAPIG